MECSACGRGIGPDDRFCNGCGTPVPADSADAAPADGDQPDVESTAPADTTPAEPDQELDTQPVDAGATSGDPDPADDRGPADGGSTDAVPETSDLPRTELVETAPASDTWEADPVWAATAAVAAQPPTGVATTDLPATEPVTEVWMERVADETPATTPYDFAEQEPVAVTGQMPVQPEATATMPVAPAAAPAEPTGFRFTLIMLISIVTGIVTLVAMFADVVSITSDVRIVATDDTPEAFRTGTWLVDDLADNLSIAGLITAATMVAGGVASGFRWRWGSGLAGGAGLAMAGLAALIVGMAQFPIDIAKAFARVPTDDPFVLTITRDLGYWLVIVAGALGVVLFFASLNDAFGDRRPGLNPWIAALGALAIVVAVAGPLINENQALFSDNWYLVEGVGEPSAMLLVGRLVQLGLFGLGGVIGFLCVRRWGLGLAIGVSLTPLWLVVSTLFELTDDPVGLGYQNPGAVDMQPHGVTIIGASAVAAMIVLAIVGAYDQSARERP